MTGSYYGKYRATVLNNVDPEFRGRIQMMCPDVAGLLPTSWAEACAPLSGTPPMGVYLVPPIGAAVWAEFEAGDIGRPIWTGCRWASKADVPTDATIGLPASPNIVLQTVAQHALILSDMPPTPATGGIMLRSTTRAMIVVNDSGIYIDNGKGASIKLVGPSVTINNGALVVT
jgi:hypothetical protein